MKKQVSLLLAIFMIFMSLPLFGTVAAAEAPAARTPLEVEFVSGTANVHSDNTTVTWEKIFDTTNETRLYARTKTDIEIVGKFKQPTAVTSFVLRSNYYRRRLDGITVLFSTDGLSWTRGYTVQENANDPQNGVANIEIATPGDDTLYSYVKVYKSVLMDDALNIYGDKTSKYIEVDLRHVAFYNEGENGKDLIEASLHKVTAKDGLSNSDKFFDFSNTTLCKTTHASGTTPTNPDPLIEGKLELPTVISDVYIKFNSARMNGTKIKASVDGETWTTIVAVSGIWANCSNKATEKIAHFHVNDTTAYNYIQIYRDHGLWGGHWEAYSIGFVGTQIEPEIIPVSMAGYQRSAVQDGTYALRLIASADDSLFTAAGMKLSCSAKNGDTWEFDFPAETLLTSITDRRDGADVTITAEELGGSKLYTAVLEGIPTSLGLFSVTATPYAVVEGEKQEYKSQTIVMDGDSAMAETVYNLKENKDSLKISGRSHELADGIACDFTASGIEFNANLAGDLKLTAKCSGETYYTLYLNGVRQPRILLDTTTEKTYTIAENIPAGTYNVKLVKQTHIGHTTSDLISITMCGSFLEAPKNKDLFVEFVGDSITCGYGVEGYPAAGETYYGTAKYCDATQAYAYKTALQLGADYSMISVSGWSVLPDANNANYVPGIYGQTSFKRSNEAYTNGRVADVVVVHLGTNDVNYRKDTYETDFVDAAKAFLEDVAEMHPGASIIWAYGSMMSGTNLTNFEAKVKTVIEEMGGNEWGFYCVKLPTNTAAGNGHPSAEGHSATADILSEFIKDNCLN